MINKDDSKEIRWSWFEHLISLKIAELIVEENKIISEELSFKNKLIGAYILVHPKTRQVYVGSTDDLYERRYKHFWHIKRNNHRNRKIREAFISTPSNTVYFFIFPTVTREQSFDIEQKFIDSYIDNPKCLNIALDSRMSGKGIKFSEERKKQISSIVKEKWRDPFHKKLKSDITKAYFSIPDNKAKMIANAKIFGSNPIFKEKQRITAIKQWSDLEARKRKSEEVKQYALLNGNKVIINDVIYPHVTEAARLLNINKDILRYRIKNKSDKYSEYKNFIN